MKTNWKAILLVLGLVGVLTACGHRNHTESDWKALLGDLPVMFVGTTPCADCPGIETFITLRRDSTAVVSERYLDRADASWTHYGRWRRHDDLLVVVLSDDRLYLKAHTPSSVMLVNAEGRAPEQMADAWLLTRRRPLTAAYFGGEYLREGADTLRSRMDPGVLTLQEIAPLRVRVRFAPSMKDDAPGCVFTAEGVVVNDRIEVELDQLDRAVHGVMVIRPGEANGVEVSASGDAAAADMGRFCPAGATLAGAYRRIVIR